MPSTVVSPDGTEIGFETVGDGPPMLLVHGAAADRNRWAPVREQLARHYRVHMLDRRGRGLSTREAPAYDIWREAEDIAAVAESLGGDVFVVAHSYGALCSLHAAQITGAFGKLVAYEPPRPEPGGFVVPPETLARMRAAGDAEEILTIFLREALQLPQSTVDGMRETDIWRARVAAAHTIPRELESVEAFVADERLGKISVPVRLFAGTESPVYLRLAVDAVAERVPGADVVPMRGQAHQAMDFDPEQFVAAVRAFEAA
ncbi:alpha/beta hydrolase [Pseudonocardia yunnanensis]|uniref:Alpha/beta fold hydrolase n=1 Tax=Pseudonocardia yunnanensis TaxID=58107 RepID=A0ABW4EWX1_9PSEU